MIKAVDIVVGYQGTTGTPVAGPLSFSFADGECVMLRGRNGSGKTTLMKTLAGLLPPLSGSFETGGEALRQAQVGALTLQQFAVRPLADEDHAEVAPLLPQELQALGKIRFTLRQASDEG